MPKTIYKYQLVTTDEQTVVMPADAKILCVQVQNGIPCLWALVAPRQVTTEVRTIDTFGTGHPINESFTRAYIGTYQLHGGELVFHVFERH